jgi:L-ribulose-5-phosphate 4-epimerase
MGEFDALREEALAANLALVEHGLVTLTWGNVSALDRDRGVMAIKPSGVDYGSMTAGDIVLVDLDGGGVVSGERRPSSDTPTHLALYRTFDEIGGIVHTHSRHATAWAQAGREIPVLGTTHADLSPHPVPVTRALTADEVSRGYEEETATVIIEALEAHGPVEIPCVLVRGHAPFCWGATAAEAVAHAVTLEEVAHMAQLTTWLDPAPDTLPDYVRDKHYERKHGPGAYYGQR